MPVGLQAEPSLGVPGKKRWAMVIDPQKCMKAEGCTKCSDACHERHNVPKMPEKKHKIEWIWKETFEGAFGGALYLLTGDQSTALAAALTGRLNNYLSTTIVGVIGLSRVPLPPARTSALIRITAFRAPVSGRVDRVREGLQEARVARSLDDVAGDLVADLGGKALLLGEPPGAILHNEFLTI